MTAAVHRYLLLAWTLIAAATPSAASWAPPGLVSWGEESYRLGPGESTAFAVTFAQIPVRRWVLLVEGDLDASHLNVRRVADGSLVFDQRAEKRHEVDVPWGVDEEISAVLTAGRRGGVYQVSVWGPPADAYLRSYSYEVNRALEAFARGDSGAARNHLLAALRDRPQDPVAGVLLAGTEAGNLPSALGPADLDLADGPADPSTTARVAAVRGRVAALRASGQLFAAVEALQGELSRPQAAALRVDLLTDLVQVMLDLGNVTQARRALDVAHALGLDPERWRQLAERVERSAP
ncbi:MAG: hypothetical protein R3D98_04390 [Candidatus Krumholzibacteriia bacterium]